MTKQGPCRRFSYFTYGLTIIYTVKEKMEKKIYYSTIFAHQVSQIKRYDEPDILAYVRHAASPHAYLIIRRGQASYFGGKPAFPSSVTCISSGAMFSS